MSTAQFRKRTTKLKLPESIYEEFDNIVKQCGSCKTLAGPPKRSKISGIRAEKFGDVVFCDYFELKLGKQDFVFFVAVDASSNLVFVSSPTSVLTNPRPRLPHFPPPESAFDASPHVASLPMSLVI